jgi:ribosomal-protein-alanine N-acetyltransferase
MARVVLTTPGPDDEADFLAAMRASRNLHRPWLYPPVTSAAYRAYLTRLDERKIGFLARADGELIGWLNLSEIVRGGFQNAFLGYGGIAGSGGHGYMTEAVQLVLRAAFVTHKLHRVEANIQPENRPSIALAERCGFVLEGFSPRYLKVGGRWRDHQRYALHVEAWRAR